MTATTIRKKLQKELQRIPDEQLEDLYEYMKFLQYKTYQKSSSIETAYASETVLGKDWNSPEEDQAWQDL